MSGGRNEAGLACRDGTGRGRVRGWWCRHEWSSSGSKGRGRDAARRGLGCRSGDETERAATPSWKAMIRSAARRRGDVDARWQDTLLRSSSGSTARVRELGSIWLSSHPRRSPVSCDGQACGSRQHRHSGCRSGCGGAREEQRRESEEEEREREEREKGVNRTLTHFYPNFCIETRETVNIEVGGNLKIYNFRVGRNFI